MTTNRDFPRPDAPGSQREAPVPRFPGPRRKASEAWVLRPEDAEVAPLGAASGAAAA